MEERIGGALKAGACIPPVFASLNEEDPQCAGGVTVLAESSDCDEDKRIQALRKCAEDFAAVVCVFSWEGTLNVRVHCT